MTVQQEIFDAVVEHLRTQRCKSMNFIPLILAGGGISMMNNCKYRLTLNGKVLKCAAGCLIPDDVYETAMEGYSAGKIYEVYKEKLPEFWDGNMNLINALQRVHDSYHVSAWDTWLKDAAKHFGLEYEPQPIEELNGASSTTPDS